MDSIYTFC